MLCFILGSCGQFFFFFLQCIDCGKYLSFKKLYLIHTLFITVRVCSPSPLPPPHPHSILPPTMYHHHHHTTPPPSPPPPHYTTTITTTTTTTITTIITITTTTSPPSPPPPLPPLPPPPSPLPPPLPHTPLSHHSTPNFPFIFSFSSQIFVTPPPVTTPNHLSSHYVRPFMVWQFHLGLKQHSKACP